MILQVSGVMSEEELRGYLCRMQQDGECAGGIMLSVAVKLTDHLVVARSGQKERCRAH